MNSPSLKKKQKKSSGLPGDFLLLLPNRCFRADFRESHFPCGTECDHQRFSIKLPFLWFA
jgi:hypothetical protein